MSRAFLAEFYFIVDKAISNTAMPRLESITHPVTLMLGAMGATSSESLARRASGEQQQVQHTTIRHEGTTEYGMGAGAQRQ
jgi:hypothetical protein